MTTGTIIMIVCLVLFGILEIFFKKDLGEMDKKYSVYGDPDFDGADELSGVLGLFSEDVGPFKRNR